MSAEAQAARRGRLRLLVAFLTVKITKLQRALCHRMKKDGVSIAQVLGFGSDGASVMLGHTGGVVGRLCGANALVYCFHCINHRGTLGAEGAADDY